jgi:polyketide biosynthesis 3-hydroxy-3-methylglutaryl-CoA synthase-like enzyme PksG
MLTTGIEAMNAFAGSAYLNVTELATYRKLDLRRFENLLMKEKTVTLPYEDPITFAVNAAKPIVDKLSQQEKDSIELLITCTESSFDFGKSMSTYIHHYLGLNRNCRLFEIKNACYSGIAGFQMGINFILSQTSPGAKALIIATDIIRLLVVEDEGDSGFDWSFAESSGGAGAVAALVSENPKIFQMDAGANGYYGYEVMDVCRPVPDCEAGDADLSLLSYLDCSEKAFLEYQKRVEGADYKETFQYLVFHTPFGGMIKGAHRNLMRKMTKDTPDMIEEDFIKRVVPGLTYCQRVGNIAGATTLLSLFSTIANGDYETVKRLGCFSYGSGCCSEFFSGTVEGEAAKKEILALDFNKRLSERYKLTMDEYDSILQGSSAVRFGTRNVLLDWDFLSQVRTNDSKIKRLYLKEIKEFHREYDFV